MKALTLHQPWATLVAEGSKTIETRSWSTKYRGPLAIHAGKSTEWDGFKIGAWTTHVAFADPPEIRRLGSVRNGELVPDRYECGLAAPAPLGAVVVVVELVDVVPIVGPDDQVQPAGSPCIVVEDNSLTLWGSPDYWHHEQDERDVSDQRPYGDFTPGRFAHLYANVCKPFKPIPARGKQGLWEWNA